MRTISSACARPWTVNRQGITIIITLRIAAWDEGTAAGTGVG